MPVELKEETHRMNAFPAKRLLILSSLFLQMTGCAQQLVFDKLGVTNEEFSRDRYDCVQQSRTSWSGGGTGGVGIAMIISAQMHADDQSKDLFRMCMEARGYTAHDVNGNENNVGKYNVYKEATASSSIIGKMDKSDIEEILTNEGAYAKIKNKNGLVGWVSKNNIK